MQYQNVYIESLSYVIPTLEIRTVDLEHEVRALYARMGMKPGWLQAVTGIRARRFWESHLRPSDVATRAAEKALIQGGIARTEVEAIVSCSVCKDYIEPSVAAFVHGNLNLSSRCTNFDTGNACLGFLTGMTQIADQIELGKIDVGLVVSGESARDPIEATIARLKEPNAGMREFKDNLATLTLGSAGVAMVLCSKKRAKNGHRFLGGIARAATEWSGLCVGTSTKMTTDPARLLSEGVKLAEKTWNDVQAEVPLQPHVTDEYALHQVGRANHDAVIRALRIPPNKAIRLYIDHGNVGSCGVPLSLAALVERKRISKGSRIGLMGIGSGLNVMMLGVLW